MLGKGHQKDSHTGNSTVLGRKKEKKMQVADLVDRIVGQQSAGQLKHTTHHQEKTYSNRSYLSSVSFFRLLLSNCTGKCDQARANKNC